MGAGRNSGSSKGLVLAATAAALCVVVGLVGVVGLNRDAAELRRAAPTESTAPLEMTEEAAGNPTGDPDASAPGSLAYVDEIDTSGTGGTLSIIPDAVDPTVSTAPFSLPRTSGDVATSEMPAQSGTDEQAVPVSTTAAPTSTTVDGRSTDAASDSTTATTTDATTTTTEAEKTTSSSTSTSTTSVTTTTATAPSTTTAAPTTTSAPTSTSTPPTTTSEPTTTTEMATTTVPTASDSSDSSTPVKATPTSTTTMVVKPGITAANVLYEALPEIDDLRTKLTEIGTRERGTGTSGGAIALPGVLDACLAESERATIDESRRSWASVDFTGELADVGFTLIRYDDPDAAWSAIEPMWEDCLGRTFPLVVDVSRSTAEKLIWSAEVRERTIPSLGSPTYAVQMAGPSAWTNGTATALEPIGLVLWVRSANVVGVIEYSSLGTTGDVIAHARVLLAAAEEADRQLRHYGEAGSTQGADER